MFKVFNPLTGLHEEAPDEVQARAMWASLVTSTTNHFMVVPTILGRYRYEATWAADFDVAWAFHCQKYDAPVTDLLAQEGPQFPLFYFSHSVFNITTGERRSNTFAYIKNDLMWHIKVHQGQVTDWYAYQYTLDGTLFEWVAFDLVTGTPIEVYERINTHTLEKRNLLDPSTPHVITNLMPLAEMPEEVQNGVANLPYKDTIFSYSEKSYGLIVEYAPPYLVPPEEWPNDIKFEHANLREQALFAARTKATELVKVVSVLTNEDGHETWEAVDLES